MFDLFLINSRHLCFGLQLLQFKEKQFHAGRRISQLIAAAAQRCDPLVENFFEIAKIGREQRKSEALLQLSFPTAERRLDEPSSVVKFLQPSLDP